MPAKEAKARIKINKLLEEAGWKLLDSHAEKANVVFEGHVKITQKMLSDSGEDFENTKNGFIDYLLLDEKGFPLIVLEAKSESKNPLVGKEQARKYAKNISCRFVILSNGNIHYFWDLEKGSPHIITRFPGPTSVKGYSRYKPNPERLINEVVKDDYIALTQMPQYSEDPNWKDEDTREGFIHVNKIRFLRPYQINAIKSIQKSDMYPVTIYAQTLVDHWGSPLQHLLFLDNPWELL